MNGSTEKYLLSQLNPDSYELILYPTEQCNFRCSYCYEDFEIGRMSDDVIAGVKALISKISGRVKSLHLSWFGGEPLLAKGVIQEISEHALRCCNEMGVNLSGGAT